MIERARLWDEIVTRVVAEYDSLNGAERHWISRRLQVIEGLQRRLDDLFMVAAGPGACRHCQGNCCHHGHNHITLANLLSFIRRHGQPPEPDFARCCPFLGPRGCQLEVASRPYNCVTFICDTIEINLAPDQREAFYALDRRLRRLYHQIARRYPGAGMNGLLISARRLSGKPFFGSTNGPPQPVRRG